MRSTLANQSRLHVIEATPAKVLSSAHKQERAETLQAAYLSDIQLRVAPRMKEKMHEQEGQKQLLRATTSTNASALRASYLVANRIAKAKKPFTTGEELILPATKDICRELLGEAAVKKIAQVPLSASTVTRCIEEIAEDIETQLLERINTSPWYAVQVDESTDIDNKAILLVYV